MPDLSAGKRNGTGRGFIHGGLSERAGAGIADLVAQEPESSALVQTQHELVDAVISLSFNRPSYVHLIALMDRQRSLHSYGSILLIEPFREQLYELMESDPQDGSISWRIIDREKPSLALCRTIRKAKVVTLEPIGFLALLVDTREMLASANIFTTVPEKAR